MYATPNESGESAKVLADKLRKVIRDNDSAGSTMAFGGGNKADWTQLSAMIGVNNTITGTRNAVAKKNMINGYKNTITNSSENIVSGTNYSVSGEGKNILMGFNKEKNEVNKAMVVALGNNIKVALASVLPFPKYTELSVFTLILFPKATTMALFTSFFSLLNPIKIFFPSPETE